MQHTLSSCSPLGETLVVGAIIVNGTFSEGQLDEVRHLTTTVATNFSIFIEWVAPFSINLTQADMETGAISYCVDIYNSSQQALLVSLCNLNCTNYMYSQQDVVPPSPCDSVDIVVTPVNGAGNGSSSHSRGTFYNGTV